MRVGGWGAGCGKESQDTGGGDIRRSLQLYCHCRTSTYKTAEGDRALWWHISAPHSPTTAKGKPFSRSLFSHGHFVFPLLRSHSLIFFFFSFSPSLSSLLNLVGHSCQKAMSYHIWRAWAVAHTVLRSLFGMHQPSRERAGAVLFMRAALCG